MKIFFNAIQRFYKKTKTVFIVWSLISVASIMVAIDPMNLNLQERAIVNWLVLTGNPASLFDKKVLFDEINSETYPELSKFVIKHRCPAGIEKMIVEQLTYKDTMNQSFLNLPYIFIKGAAFDRLINAERMKRCIEMNYLDCLSVAQKYLYKNGDFWGVAALRVDTQDCLLALSLAEVQQLFILAMETGYRDWKFHCDIHQKQYRNLMYDKQGCIVCIDTEDLSFEIIGHCHYWPTVVPHDCKANYAMSLLYHKDYMQPEAKAWIENKVVEVLKQADAFTKCLSLPLNTKYDDPNINIKSVKKEFKRYMHNETGNWNYIQNPQFV